MNDYQAQENSVIRYLLGDLPEEEASRIGEKSVVDTEFAEFIDAVELELMELYLRERLNESDRRLFNSNFLLTDERRQQLRALSLFVIPHSPRSGEGRQPAVFSKQRDFRRWFSALFVRRPVLVACAAMFVLAVFIGEFALVRDWWIKKDAPTIAMGRMAPKIQVLVSRSAEEAVDLVVIPDRPVVTLFLGASGNSPYMAELQQDGTAFWRQENTPLSSIQGSPVIVISIPTSLLMEGQLYTVAWKSPNGPVSDQKYRVKYQR